VFHTIELLKNINPIKASSRTEWCIAKETMWELKHQYCRINKSETRENSYDWKLNYQFKEQAKENDYDKKEKNIALEDDKYERWSSNKRIKNTK
jgi:hypothetical protein